MFFCAMDTLLRLIFIAYRAGLPALRTFEGAARPTQWRFVIQASLVRTVHVATSK
jgi:hypothetical protein